MGYQTNYNLTMPRNPISDIQLAEWVQNEDEVQYSLTLTGRCSGNDSRWYEHDVSMVVLSEKYPDTIFKLHGEGEEAGDIWDKYYANGKLQRTVTLDATLPIPDLDELVSGE